jgi:DNA-binding MarR family transcriptional regulator
MDYEISSQELLDCLVISERMGIHQGNVSNIAKGELAVLIYLIDEKDGANAYELSEYFNVNTSRIAAILNSLCKKEYIQRIKDENDKRKIHVYISEKGKKLAYERKKEVLMNLNQLLKALGEEDATQYLRIMKKITNYYIKSI